MSAPGADTVTRAFLRATIGAVLAGTGACSLATEPAADLPYTVALRTCGPTDGPAVVLSFSATPFTEFANAPALLVTIYRPVTEIAGRTYRLDVPSDEVYAFMSGTADKAARAVTGTLRVDRVTPDSSVLAHVDVRLPDKSRLRRPFLAQWVPRPGMLCG